MKAKSDFIFIGILGLFIASTIALSLTYNYILSANNYLGFFCWAIAFILRLTHFKWKRYVLGFVIIFGTLNILNFGIGVASATISYGSPLPIEPVSINPVILIILIAYYFTNKPAINRVLSRAIKGTEEEQAKEHQKMVAFYSDKFKSSSEEELKEAFKNYLGYPEAAKVALDKIKTARDQF